MALFQAISRGRALLAGGAGSTLGALAGHVAGGTSRGDLKEPATGRFVCLVEGVREAHALDRCLRHVSSGVNYAAIASTPPPRRPAG